MGTVLLTFLTVLGQAEQMDEERREEVDAWRVAIEGLAKEHRIVLADTPDRPLKKLERPVFLWNQVVRQGQIGSAFLWVQEDGRPAVLGGIFAWHLGTPNWFVMHEFHSLAEQPLKMSFRGKTLWTPQQAGVTWRPIEGVMRVAKSPTLQKSQIRRIARLFKARTVTGDDAQWDLRLLPRALYEYSCGDKDEPRCGAVFVMCQGTDPELVLMVEARPVGAGLQWQYACGTFTDFELHLEYQGEEIWNAPATPDGTVFSPDKSYWRAFITQTGRLPEK